MKKPAALGADPKAAGPRPEYMLRKPPALQNPCSDCNRVLRVSRGNKDTSTAVPAAAPATNDISKRVLSEIKQGNKTSSSTTAQRLGLNFN